MSNVSIDLLTRDEMLIDQQATDIAPMGIDQLWKTIMESRNPDGSVHIKAETFNLLNVMISDLRKVQTRLDKMATQLEQMDELAAKVDALSRNRPGPSLSPLSASSWADVTKKNTDKQKPIPRSSIYDATTPRAPPPNKQINEFKPGQVTIRTTNTERKPFEEKTTMEIVDNINFALTVKDIKMTGSPDPITIRSAVRLPTGDVKIYTNN